MSDSNKNDPLKMSDVDNFQAPQLPEELKARIQEMISSSDVFLFMKGIPEAPRCGFSANVVGILKQMDLAFGSFDILSDMDIRQGLKIYSNWPTYPQLYFKGELLGGNDVVMELYESGELEEIIKGA